MKQVLPFLILLCLFNSCRKRPLLPENRITPNDLLSDRKYEKLVVEVVHEKGYPLTAQTISNLQNFLSSRLNKKKGISFSDKEIDWQGKNVITLSEIKEIEKKFRSGYSAGKTLTVFVFVSGSDFAENSGDAQVLGVAYGSTSVALFEKTIGQHSGGLAQPPKTILESTVSEHEFGHLMGLVDNGTKMVDYHRDAANGSHCDKKNCLMYYAAETSDIVGNLLGGEVPALENYCIRDLQFNGGK
jgi:hypothetical protein